MPERSSIGRAGEDRRVDPLVELDLVAGVEEDAEERVAQPTLDDRGQLTADGAHPERCVPLGDGLEVGRHEPLHVVGDAGRQLGRILDDEARPTGQPAPDPERDREPIAPLDGPVAGAEQAERGARTGA